MISVIVPVYRVEPYLEACVQSIRCQTFSDLEIILVDDGSPDRCGAICDDLAQKDSRIRVIHKKNGGLSDARNAGIDAATGDCIGFVDSDDRIHPRMYELLYQALVDQKSAISMCLFQNFREGDEPQPAAESASPVVTLERTDALKRLFTSSLAYEVIVCNKLYRRCLFDTGIRFPVGKLHEDNFTTYRLFGEANSVSFLAKPLYFYLRRTDSITGHFDPRRLEVLEAGAAAQEYVRAQRLPLQREAEAFHLRIAMGLLNSLLLEKGFDRDVKKELDAVLFDPALRYFSNPYFSVKNKILMLIYRCGGMSVYRLRIRHALKI